MTAQLIEWLDGKIAFKDDHHAEICKSIRAQLIAAQWQPIDTAPADGTECLIASYIVPSDAAQQNGSKPFWDIAIGHCFSRTLKESRWTSVLGSSPSHWMPLPTPPKATEAGIE